MNRGHRVAAAATAVLVATTGMASARAATTLQVSRPTVAGDAPGGLTRATGTGFTPGLKVRVTITGEDGAAPLALATTTADDAGGVALPATARMPLLTPVGPTLHLTMTGTDGVTATSGGFLLATPSMLVDSATVAADPAMHVYLRGVANRPDAVRTVSIDGRPVAGVTWYSDARSFDWAGVDVPVPSDLAPGPHSVTFRQTGPTPFTASSTTQIVAPWVYVPNVLSYESAPVRVDAGYDDVLDVVVVDSAGVRHVAGPLTLGASDRTSGTLPVPVQGFAFGTATATVTSRHNGGSATTTFHINGPTTSTGLSWDERLGSTDGRFVLKLQVDGDLVLYRDKVVVWRTGKFDGNDYSTLTVQPDGNVALRNGWSNVTWSTGTTGIGAGARFGIDATGDLAVFTASGRQAWSAFLRTPRTVPTLAANRYLFRGQSLSHALTAGGSVTFTMQSDGNAVVSQEGWTGRWSTGTAGHPNAYLLLQNDGALVVRAADGTTLWTNKVRAAGARLVAQSDGNIVEYAPNGKALWSSRTAVQR